MRHLVRSGRAAITLAAGLILAASGIRPASALQPKGTPITSCPYVITVPGEYYLANDLSCPGPVAAVIIASDNVRLNLNGHVITGFGKASGFGIFVAPLAYNVRITNGGVLGFFFGVFLAGAYHAHVCGVTARHNLVGIAGGEYSVKVSQCLVTDNEVDGICLNGDNHYISCNRVARNGLKSKNGEAGICLVGNNAKFVTNTAADNYRYGIAVVGDGNTFYNNTTTGNGASGLWVAGDENLITRNKCSSNRGHGIELAEINEPPLLVVTSEGNRVERNLALGNTLEDLFDAALPAVCANSWTDNTFGTDNDPANTCIH